MSMIRETLQTAITAFRFTNTNENQIQMERKQSKTCLVQWKSNTNGKKNKIRPVRDAVANYLIHRGATRLRKALRKSAHNNWG
jgi:hypothetical protein